MTIEAVLVLPVLLILFGAVAQVMIIGQARLYVEQAAYAAARSAMVYKCPPFDPLQAFRSPIAAIKGFQCSDQPQKWLDAARWSLVAASSPSGFAPARGTCPQIRAGEQVILAANSAVPGAAVANSLCYAFEPGNVEVTVEWVKTGINKFLPGTSPAMRATVRFKYPLSTPFRRFINDGKRGDGTYWRWGEATVVLL